MSEELKACPFCGKSVCARFEGDPPRCDCDIYGAYFSMQEKDWNTRPIEAAQAAEIERLREENKALVAALEPFGRPENAWLTDLPDSTPVVVNDSGIIFLSLALRDLRKAREVLSKVRHGL